MDTLQGDIDNILDNLPKKKCSSNTATPGGCADMCNPTPPSISPLSQEIVPTLGVIDNVSVASTRVAEDMGYPCCKVHHR